MAKTNTDTNTKRGPGRPRKQESDGKCSHENVTLHSCEASGRTVDIVRCASCGDVLGVL